MSKSPVCDGQNFALGLESTYRNMWHRYCKGDVPSLKRMEMLQQQVVSEEPNKFSEPTKIIFAKEGSPGSVMPNGFNQASPSMLNLSNIEENGVQLNQHY